ncbi:hypothetical protein [Streptomyces milbemycinicus]|uniref:hypothetical protein n=1 Tax=Streptomyces milbemycinicus TaxID=476552 RepID=UPI0033F32C21
MNVRDQVLAVLNSESRETFLVAMGHRLGISARDIFTEDRPGALSQAQACNEMMICIWSQVWATKGSGVTGHPGYPDADFLPVLLGKADAGDARSHLRNAIESALLAVREAGDGGAAPQRD